MKYQVFIPIIMVLAGFATAQAVQTPQAGGGLQILTDSINANTRALNETQKKIEDQYGFLQEQNRQWAGVLIVGNSAFMLSLYLAIVFFDRMRLRRKKKKHEEYIAELESELKATKEGIIETLTHVNTQNTDLLWKTELLLSKYEKIHEHLTTIQPQIKVMSWLSFGLGISLCVFVYLFANYRGLI